MKKHILNLLNRQKMRPQIYLQGKLVVNLLLIYFIIIWWGKMCLYKTQEEIYNEFLAICKDELQSYQNAVQIYSEKLVEETLYSRDSVYKIVEASFRQVYCGWESFLENSFISFMLGNKCRSGKEIISYVNPKDAEHARNLIKGINRFPEWNDIDKILICANNMFENGGPYQVLKTMTSELNAIKRIRNYIAHDSISARIDFNNMVRSTVGHLPEGIAAGSYLTDYHHAHDVRKSFFEHYLQYLEDSANMLTG